MLNGSTTSLVFVKSSAHVHHLNTGGSGGDYPSRYPWEMKSLLEIDAIAPSVARATGSKRPAVDEDELLLFPFQCPICKHTFCTEKAVQGHMRYHWELGWCGMVPPRTPIDGELGMDGWLHQYVCDSYKAPFDTKPGFDVHSAIHGGNRSFSWLANQDLMEAAEYLKPVVFDFDLNKLAPEAQKEEEEE